MQEDFLKIPVIVIFAPTATGKTALTLKLFGKSGHSFFNGKAELISADSLQAYKDMNIGTAKPSKDELAELKTHLIDIHTFDEVYGVSEFVEKADFLARKIYSEKKIPVIQGGTGFYIRNFILGLPETPESSLEVRENLKEKLKVFGKEALYSELQKIDPESAEKIHINDEYRILRALEIFYSSGKKRSSFNQNKSRTSDFDYKIIILERSREDLYKRINSRVDLMFEEGLKNEIEFLKNSGAEKSSPGMHGIGYREWFEYSDENVIREKIKQNTRKYAKKQYTFVKNLPNSIVINADDDDSVLERLSSEVFPFFQKI